MCGRVVQAPIPHEHVDYGASDRAVSRRGTGSGPEFFEALAGLGGAATRHPVGKRNCVHGAGAGAADRLDVKPLVLKKLVEDAPGKSAVRAAALQGEFDRFRGPPIHQALPNLPCYDAHLGSDELGAAGRPAYRALAVSSRFSVSLGVRRCAGRRNLTRINPRTWSLGRTVSLSAQTVSAPSTRKLQVPGVDAGAQIPAVNLTTPIVAVLGFESQEICPASQFTPSLAGPSRLAIAQARTQLLDEGEHANQRLERADKAGLLAGGKCKRIKIPTDLRRGLSDLWPRRICGSWVNRSLSAMRIYIIAWRWLRHRRLTDGAA
jgi:hypothetical protein